ncbi:unnamed protein product, partial [Ectocarpus sp. 6 AP-2014]
SCISAEATSGFKAQHLPSDDMWALAEWIGLNLLARYAMDSAADTRISVKFRPRNAEEHVLPDASRSTALALTCFANNTARLLSTVAKVMFSGLGFFSQVSFASSRRGSAFACLP